MTFRKEYLVWQMTFMEGIFGLVNDVHGRNIWFGMTFLEGIFGLALKFMEGIFGLA
jgi:hypothetical protein